MVASTDHGDSPHVPPDHPDRGEGSKLGTGAIPRAVWLIVVVHGLLLFGYSILFPPYRAPDEHAHFDRILVARQEWRVPEFDEREISGRVFNTRRLVRGDEGDSRHLEADLAPPRADRPRFDEIPRVSRHTTRNIVVNHPPLYYSLIGGASAFVTSVVPGVEWSWDRFVGLLRIFNVLLLVPLPLLAYLVARRLGGSAHAGTAAALFPLAVPMLTNIGATVNNDNLLVLLGSIAILLLVRVATGDDSLRTSVWIGVIGGLALLVKGFALTIPIWIGAAYLAALRRWPSRRLLLQRLGTASAIAFLVGGWWWIRNLVLFDRLQTGMGIRNPAPPEFAPDVFWWIGRYLSWLADRFWGSFGRVDVTLPRVLVLAATVAALIMVAAAFLRDRDVGRPALLVALVPVAILFVLVTYRAYGAYERTGEPVGFHGRYLFAGLAGLAAVAGVGLSRMLRGVSRLSPLAMAAGAAVMQLWSIAVILPWYWGPAGSPPLVKVRAMLAWSPWPEGVVLVVAGLGAGFAAWLLVELARLARRPADRGSPVRA